MVAMDSGADNGFFYTSQVMHFSSPFTVFLIYHKHFCVSWEQYINFHILHIGFIIHIPGIYSNSILFFHFPQIKNRKKFEY